MVSSAATTVEAYLSALPADRRATVAAVRAVVNRNLPAGYAEGMLYGMIGWAIPLATFPHTYNRQPLAIAALAAQKQAVSLYLMGVYGHPETAAWFKTAWAKSGKKLDMGKSCVRFKTVDDLPLDVIGEVIGRVRPEHLIAAHEAVHGERKPVATAAKAGAKPTRPAKPAAKPTKAGAKPAKPTKAGAKPAKPTKAGAKPNKPTKAGAKPAKPAKPTRPARPAAKRR